MHQNVFARLGDFAIQQVAAESYVDEFFAGRLQSLEDVYVLGNNRPGFPDRSFTRMTPEQASVFVVRFKILRQEHHYPNDSSGFSVTLFAGASLSVAGFSLGGHLATMFTEMHARDVNISLAGTCTFNDAGRGT